MHTQQSMRRLALGRVKTARVDLLIVIIFTIFNIAMIFAESETVMLFSAAIPFYAVALAYSAQLAYGGLMWLVQGSLILAAVVLVLYVLCWYLSKKHYGWLIGAAVLFGLDTLAVLFLYGAIWGELLAGAMDILLHGLLMYYLIQGAVSGYRLKHMPQEIEEELPQQPVDTWPIEAAAPMAGQEILLETAAYGLHIGYRRVERVYELIINDYVFDRAEVLVESNHALRAVCNGHVVEAGFQTGSAMYYILVDGTPVAHRSRWSEE